MVFFFVINRNSTISILTLFGCLIVISFLVVVLLLFQILNSLLYLCLHFDVLVELFLHQFCHAHTCSRKHKHFPRGGKVRFQSPSAIDFAIKNEMCLNKIWKISFPRLHRWSTHVKIFYLFTLTLSFYWLVPFDGKHRLLRSNISGYH